MINSNIPNKPLETNTLTNHFLWSCLKYKQFYVERNDKDKQELALSTVWRYIVDSDSTPPIWLVYIYIYLEYEWVSGPSNRPGLDKAIKPTNTLEKESSSSKTIWMTKSWLLKCEPLDFLYLTFCVLKIFWSCVNND